MSLIGKIREKLNLPAKEPAPDDGNFQRLEKVVVFTFSFIIAIGMWMLINLGNDYNLTLQMPLEYGNFPEDRAPVQRLPEYATATISGEGWKLLNLYGSAPRVSINPETETQNLLEAVQTQLAGHSDLNIVRVQPMSINIRMEDRITRKVPVELNVDMEFRRQFNMIGEPEVSPDSVTISGARSLVEPIQSWPSRSVSFSDVHQPVNTSVELQSASDLVKISHSQVNLRADIAEFTEAETRVPVEVRNVRGNERFTLTPTSVMVRYDVPVAQYARAQESAILEAYIRVEDLEEDTSGAIQPTIRNLSPQFDIRVRSVQPRRVTYFRVVED